MNAPRAAAAAACLTLLLLPVRLLPAQPATPHTLAERLAASEGAVVVRFATRAAACGDGRDLIALGDRLTTGSSYVSFGGARWGRQSCLRGPARVTLTVRGGAVTDVRVSVGAPAAAAGAARDLGVVGAPEAAAYFVDLAARTAGGGAERAVTAAALADSADVWRPLLALARRHDDDRVVRSAMHWLGAVAPAEAVPALAAALRDPGERRAVRGGAAVALAVAPEGSGVPALAGAAGGVPSAGGSDPWVRDKAVFWLGNARDARARATLRALAAADTTPEAVRAQAIFALGHLDRGDDGGGGDAGDGVEGNAAFLRALHPRLTASPRLQDKVIQSVAQEADAASRRWLLDLAADGRQPLTARKQALFWAGQNGGTPVGELVAVDARLDGAELRRHYAFVLSQRGEDAAVDRLVAIARADADPGVRRQAIFWLGQSRNPRARAYLEGVVAR
jgi:HEAT repeat protein